MSVNGQYSGWFRVVWCKNRYETKGSAVSMWYLFLICAEFLSILVRQNKSIGGIKILDEEILLSQFADDTTFFLMANKNCFMHVYVHYNSLAWTWFLCGQVCKNAHLQECSHVKFIPELNLHWNPATFKVLGMVFSTNVHETVLINYKK